VKAGRECKVSARIRASSLADRPIGTNGNGCEYRPGGSDEE